ncbi:MAG: 3-isopropylmalate dehydratase large subunit [Anaerolineae bacterium]|nr:3-isopropylmalate dehydratase large subunit [Anaerolineae bacterium]MDW8070108.1 3-isopropylmalate dehydratase large subunit [Anaerolineae bacterium]
MTLAPRTLFEKIWEDHVVVEEPDSPAVLYIDLHLIHEVTSPQAFEGLRRRGLRVRRPQQTVATIDHSIPTTPPEVPIADPQAARQIQQIVENCREFGIPLHGIGSPTRGIVHVIGPELGLTQPGMTIVCGDSHTSTHGAFGALAFGIGTSEVEHVLATQCLLQRKPRTCQIYVDGYLRQGVTAKDLILGLIAQIGSGGGTGYVFEYAGPAIRALSMEERMTVCNMSIEAGARAGMIAPDDTTFEYLAGRPYAPKGEAWDAAVKQWRTLPSDPDARFDHTITLDATRLEPMITYGTNPAMAIPISGVVPDPASVSDLGERQAVEKALRYMDLRPGQRLLGHPIDVVFIGSCTNGRLSDLRQAARLLKGRRVKEGVRVLVVPGSQSVKRAAEAEGLHRIFLEAGAEWRESGCSMCIAMNGDQLQPGQYAVSTSNRNFEGRQGPGGRTFLASPLTAAAAAVSGVITDPRTLLE